MGCISTGLMLISVVLDFTTIRFNINNELPFILFLPGYAATAWYHKKAGVGQPLKKFLQGSRRLCQRRLCHRR